MNSVNDMKLLEIPEMKSKSEWRDELLNFGLKNDSLSFFIEGGLAPLFICIASDGFTEMFGNNPRITISKKYQDDAIFKEVCEQYNLVVTKNYGVTVQGYDFSDKRTAQELGSFLMGFEQAYRKIKFNRSH